MTSICPECRGLGAFSYECNRCNGTGIFSNPLSDSPSGKCRQCGGSGRFFPQWKASEEHPLKTFRLPFVSMTLASGTEILVYRCRVCRGSGKIEGNMAGECENA